HIDNAESALTDLLQQFVLAHQRPGAFLDRQVEGGIWLADGWTVEKSGPVVVGGEELFDAQAQRHVAAARRVEVTRPVGRGFVESFEKNGTLIHRRPSAKNDCCSLSCERAKCNTPPNYRFFAKSSPCRPPAAAYPYAHGNSAVKCNFP